MLAGTLCFDLWVFFCKMIKFEGRICHLSSDVEIGYEDSGIREVQRLDVLVGRLFLDCKL